MREPNATTHTQEIIGSIYLNGKTHANTCQNPRCRETGQNNVRKHKITGPDRVNKVLCCHACGKHFSETRGTVAWRSKLTKAHIDYLLIGFRRGYGVRRLAALAGVNRNTVRRYREIFRRVNLI